jgi:RNA polymerase sigma factor (sigma-70 family)
VKVGAFSCSAGDKGIPEERNLSDLPQAPDFIARLRARDRGALRETYLSYATLIRRTLRRLQHLWRLSGDEVDDLVHEVFMRVLSMRIRPELSDAEELGHYLIRVTTNLCLDVARRGRSRSLRARGIPSDSQEERPGDWLEHRAYDIELLRISLEALSPELRSLYAVRFKQGLSERQAALALALSRRQLRKLQDRLLLDLRQSLTNLRAKKSGPAAPPSRFPTRSRPDRRPGHAQPGN